MKTRNYFPKAITITSVLIGLILISITSNAQGDNSLNQIAMVMLDASDEASKVSKADSNSDFASMPAKLFIKEADATLELEAWMKNEKIFFRLLDITAELEIDLELEDWMKNEKVFGVRNIEIDQEKESELELEDWMTSEQFWKVR